MSKLEKQYSIGVGKKGHPSLIEIVQCQTPREAEHAANVLWQQYESQYEELYVVAWNNAYDLDYETMDDAVVYLRCRPGFWITHNIGDHEYD